MQYVCGRFRWHIKSKTRPTCYGFLSLNETEKILQQLIPNALAEPVVSYQGRTCNYKERGRQREGKKYFVNIVLPSLLHIVH